MKRVLIVNKFYYNRGGDCVCAINLENLLKAKGHQVAVFAMRYDENIASEHSSYFASEVSFAGGIGAKLNAAKRIFGFGDIKSQFAKILHEFRPDVVHLHNIHSYISPIVAKMAKEFGAKVVWTLHDYKLLCPAYTCLRNNETCELCFNNKCHILKHKCMKGSTVASVLAYLEAQYWNRSKLEKYTDAFICPSRFIMSKMKDGKFSRLYHICNFIDPIKAKIFSSLSIKEDRDYCVYIGRLSAEKGTETMLAAINELGYSIKIAGGGPLLEQLKQKYASNPKIQFLGHLGPQSVASLIAEARFSIVPSEWYENNPLSIIESFCAGTPVVGTNIGGIPELISPRNGIIAISKNVESLKSAIKQAWEQKWDYSNIKSQAAQDFSADKYYSLLIDVYNK